MGVTIKNKKPPSQANAIHFNGLFLHQFRTCRCVKLILRVCARRIPGNIEKPSQMLCPTFPDIVFNIIHKSLLIEQAQLALANW